MSTYPVDIKTANITSTATTTVFDGPARVLGVSWTQPTNVAAGTITVNDNTTGIKVDSSLKVTNAVTTHVTVYYG